MHNAYRLYSTNIFNKYKQHAFHKHSTPAKSNLHFTLQLTLPSSPDSWSPFLISQNNLQIENLIKAETLPQSNLNLS